MRQLRLVLSLFLVALLALGCRSVPVAGVQGAPPVAAGFLKGQVVLPALYGTQAAAGQVRANATVTLVDPSTFQAKGTGITAPDGTFTVQALGSFTPVLGGLYLLESTKSLGGTSKAAFRLRTLVQFKADGWTSVSGPGIRLSTGTTAVAILWDRHGLAASDVIERLAFDAPTGTTPPAALGSGLSADLVRAVDVLVNEALRLNLDPVQTVRPGPDGAFALALSDPGRNRLVNAGFEAIGSEIDAWHFYAPTAAASWSVHAASPAEGRQAVRVTIGAAGDFFLGQGMHVSWNRRTGNLNLVAGRTYTFSVYARGGSGGERLRMELNPQDGAALIQGPTWILTSAWQRYTFSFTPVSSTGQGILLLRAGSSAGEATFAPPKVLDLDALQLEEGGATEFLPQQRLTLSGFANAFESTGVTPTDGRGGGTAVFIDRSANVLANSSFEKDSDADGIPDGMTRTAPSAATYSLDVDALFHGRSLKIDKAAATADYAKFNHVYTFEAGKTYVFSVWVKGLNVQGPASSTDFGIYLDPYLPSTDLSGPDVRHVAAPVGTFDWTRISFTHTFLNTCTSAAIIPIFRNKSGTVWFDGFQVEQGTAATPYAGEPGIDRLTYDASRYVGRRQGTIAFWYRPTYAWADGGFNFLSIDGANSVAWPVCFLEKTSDSLRLWTHGGPGSSWDAHATWTPAATPWQPGEWHHLAISWGPRGKEVYFDGDRVATGPFSGSLNGAYRLNLLKFAGLDFLSTNTFSKVNPQGSLDALEVWDSQRSPEDLRRTYLGIAP